jgi:hypothetical protein
MLSTDEIAGLPPQIQYEMEGVATSIEYWTINQFVARTLRAS